MSKEKFGVIAMGAGAVIIGKVVAAAIKKYLNFSM